MHLQDQLGDTSYCILDSKVPLSLSSWYHSEKKNLIINKETSSWVGICIHPNKLRVGVWFLNLSIYLLRRVISTQGNNSHNPCCQFHGKPIIWKYTNYSIIGVLTRLVTSSEIWQMTEQWNHWTYLKPLTATSGQWLVTSFTIYSLVVNLGKNISSNNSRTLLQFSQYFS